jgi:hypothetical protein
MSDRTQLKLWTCAYSHRHGTDIGVYLDHTDAVASMAAFVLNDYWNERADKSAPEDPVAAGWTDQQIFDAYFTGKEEEFCNIEETTLNAETARLLQVLALIPTPSPSPTIG